MDLPNSLYVPTRAAWRRWLAEHHASAREVWLIYYKRDSGKPRVEYKDAVEEALCYGWIDSIVRTIDSEKYAQRFTPRRLGSVWSPSNLARIKKLVADGSMTAAGRVLLPTAAEARKHLKAHAAWQEATADRRARPVPTPPELAALLKKNRKAAKQFASLTPGYRRRYCGWIAMAKQAETRVRRAREAVKLLAKGVKALLK